MENASKALLMAGGILIAIIVIGTLLLMVNNIGSFQNSQDSNKKAAQLAEFNLDFERYTDDNGISGVDIISLTNKIIDYNKKAENGGVINSVDYNIKMSITVSNLNEFNTKYVGKLQNSYTMNKDNTLKEKLESIDKNTYSGFKSSKFKISRNPVYENGQIKDLYFEFVE